MNFALIKIKHFLQKIYLWLKNNFMLVFLAAGVLYMFLTIKSKERNEKDLWEKFKQQLESNHKSMDDLKKIQNDQLEAQQQINKKYAEVIQELETNHKEQLALLTSRKEKELKELIVANKDDPELMAAEINKLFGIQILSASSNIGDKS